MTEMATWAKYIARAVNIPVIADTDDAYGNALIAMRTIEEFERTGVAGVQIEDQGFPKRCGHLAGEYCLPIEESVGKLRAVLDARSDPDFYIIARTDAISAVGGGMDEAIERGKRYAGLGADLIWPEFPSPEPEYYETYAEAFHKEFPDVPLGFDYSSAYEWTKVENPVTFKELAEIGYKFIHISIFALHAAMYSEWNFLKDLSENQEQAQIRLQALKKGHPTENHHIMGQFEYFQQLEEKYLPRKLVEER